MSLMAWVGKLHHAAASTTANMSLKAVLTHLTATTAFWLNILNGKLEIMHFAETHKNKLVFDWCEYAKKNFF